MLKRNFWLFFFGLLCFREALFSDNISISANPGTFTINTATAGQQPTALTNTSTTYNFSTSSLFTKRITGKISSALPSGVTLQVKLATISGATSAGFVTMSTTTQDLVTSIPPNSTGTSLIITYQLSAAVVASQVTNSTATLTLNLTL
jgi:hypothetical protein